MASVEIDLEAEEPPPAKRPGLMKLDASEDKELDVAVTKPPEAFDSRQTTAESPVAGGASKECPQTDSGEPCTARAPDHAATETSVPVDSTFQEDSEDEDRDTGRVVPTPSHHYKYVYEENLYGVIVLPFFNFSPPYWLMFFAFYFSTLTVTYIMTSTVLTSYSEQGTNLNDLCTQSGGRADCRPDRYAMLMDISSLDSNGDGHWSVGEAREAGLLQQFRGLHDVLLETPGLLEEVAPRRPPNVIMFCYLTQYHAMHLVALSHSEYLEMANTSGLLTGALQSRCRGSVGCIQREICREGGEHLKEDSRSNHDVYMELTKFMSVFPASVLPAVQSNLVLPCRLVNSGLCGNAEAAGKLAVPMWSRITPEQRVAACREYVEGTCARILGSDFTHRQTQMGAACGERTFTTEAVTAPLVVTQSQPSCSDNSTYFTELWMRVKVNEPALALAATSLERLMGSSDFFDTAGCLTGTVLCSMMGSMRDPFDNDPNSTKLTTFFQVVGQACPRTCCNLRSPGCPKTCAAAALSESSTVTQFGRVMCVGTSGAHAGCDSISFEVDPASGGLWLEVGGLQHTGFYHVAKLIIQTDIWLRIQFLKLDLGDVSDTLCVESFLEVDGTKYCKGNRRDHVILAPREDGLVEILWLCAGALRCEWTIMIVDSGQPDTSSVSAVEFSSSETFFDTTKGLMSARYKVFLTTVFFLWTVFVCAEAQAAVLYARFVLTCPKFPGRRFRRLSIFAFICIPRLTVAVWLYIVGVILLMSSPDYTDVVLNAVALAFILEMDEAMYAIAVPREIKKQVQEDPGVHWGAKAPGFFDQFPSLGVMSTTLVPLLLAMAIALFQYNWHRGWNEVGSLVHCACQLKGERCVDAMLGN